MAKPICIEVTERELYAPVSRQINGSQTIKFALPNATHIQEVLMNAHIYTSLALKRKFTLQSHTTHPVAGAHTLHSAPLKYLYKVQLASKVSRP